MLKEGTEATLCIVERDKKILMKRQIRGEGKGHWVFPGGKKNGSKETPLECAVRELYEETGLRARKLEKIGVFEFYVDGIGLNYVVHAFSVVSFNGEPRSTEEGEVRWVHSNRMPFHKMWDGDKYWVPLALHGKKFDAKFYYDKDNTETLRYDIELRK